MLRTILISLGLLLLSVGVDAHNPDLSSTILSKQEGKWILQVRAALTAYEYEIHLLDGQDAYTTAEEFQGLVLRHVKENIAIRANDESEITLTNGVVRLGHETNTIFEVTGLPENFVRLKVTNSSFRDITGNQSALIIFKEGLAKKQFTLNNANKHTVNLVVKGGHLMALNNTEPEKTARTTPVLYASFGILSVLFFILFLKFRPSKPEA